MKKIKNKKITQKNIYGISCIFMSIRAHFWLFSNVISTTLEPISILPITVLDQLYVRGYT